MSWQANNLVMASAFLAIPRPERVNLLSEALGRVLKAAKIAQEAEGDRAQQATQDVLAGVELLETTAEVMRASDAVDAICLGHLRQLDNPDSQGTRP